MYFLFRYSFPAASQLTVELFSCNRLFEESVMAAVPKAGDFKSCFKVAQLKRPSPQSDVMHLKEFCFLLFYFFVDGIKSYCWNRIRSSPFKRSQGFVH